MYAVLYGSILSYSSGVRPFGVSLLICGWDDDRPFLFQCDPSVSQLHIIIPYHVSHIGCVFSMEGNCNG